MNIRAFCRLKPSLMTGNIFTDSLAKSSYLNTVFIKNLHITSPSTKEIKSDNRKTKVGVVSKYGIVEGEETVDVNKAAEDLFPTEKTPDTLFNGIPYKELPIINIKAGVNNTIMNLTDYKGHVIALYSAGIEGFKNARKGTNVAAQQAAISFTERVQKKRISSVRVRVQGLGPGRLSAIKGLQIGGLNIISITDDTRVSWNGAKPRKVKRL